jgi:hypothetical protein
MNAMGRREPEWVRDLPFELPTRYELIVNLNTAKAMGLTIPDSFCSWRTR